jgi:hypothetical protein
VLVVLYASSGILVSLAFAVIAFVAGGAFGLSAAVAYLPLFLGFCTPGGVVGVAAATLYPQSIRSASAPLVAIALGFLGGFAAWVSAQLYVEWRLTSPYDQTPDATATLALVAFPAFLVAALFGLLARRWIALSEPG